MPAYIPNVKELEETAKLIIDQHIPLLKLLKIQFMFRPEAAISDDKIIAGMCIRCDDRNWAVHKHDFIIEIAKDVWDDATDDFKMALMHHELSHIAIRMEEDGVSPSIDEKSMRIKTGIHKHEIEEFEKVLEVHGPYHKALREFLAAFAKHKLNQKAKKGKDATIDTDSDDADAKIEDELEV